MRQDRNENNKACGIKAQSNTATKMNWTDLGWEMSSWWGKWEQVSRWTSRRSCDYRARWAGEWGSLVEKSENMWWMARGGRSGELEESMWPGRSEQGLETGVDRESNAKGRGWESVAAGRDWEANCDTNAYEKRNVIQSTLDLPFTIHELRKALNKCKMACSWKRLYMLHNVSQSEWDCIGKVIRAV